jgi:FMN phosphatase YigB (HAD superfamily)
MLKFKEYIAEQEDYKDGGLTIFDIDDTLFHTTAKISVLKDGKKVKELTNQEFNTYKLKDGEEFDFGEFKDAKKFYKESKPIQKMLDTAKAILRRVEKKPDSQVVIITARNNFDDKNLFLKTFKKHGLNIDKIRVERAGKINDVGQPDLKKYIIIYNMLKTKQFSRVRLFDDSMANLKAFLKLKKEFPMVKFDAFFAKPDGTVKTIK